MSVRVGGEKGLHIGQISDLSIEDHLKVVADLKLTKNEETIARPILKEVKDRLTFLNNVGLSYLTLSRSAGTLSGGESQRIRFGDPDLGPTSQVSSISWMSLRSVFISGTMIA